MQKSNPSFAFGKKKYNYVYKQDKIMVKIGVVYTIFAILFTTNILTLAALFLSPNISSLLSDKSNEAFVLYERKIAELRSEIDLLYSRQYAQDGNLNLQIQELSQQQATLIKLQPLILDLVNKADSLGVSNIPALSNKQITKELDNFTTGSIDKSNFSLTKQDNLSHLLKIENSISKIAVDSYLTLSAISDEANKNTNKMLQELKSVGIIPRFPNINNDVSVGGPFIPESGKLENIQQNLLNEAMNVNNSLARFIATKKAIQMSPLHIPLKHGYRISSPYGGRNDPIIGKRAFHSGTDMAMAWGSPVMSAGDGVVVFVGRKGAYGKTVEIKLDGGLLTRFAHLSSYTVKKGQRVKAGSIVAKVGSTGRSTGPHLHFEIRNGNETLNSTNFLKVSKRLRQFI